jgi:glycosyltransferase involved in cell wall biosynthesis
MTERPPLRLLGLASSEPEFRDPRTGVGGVVHYLFAALAARATLAGVLHPEPALPARLWAAASALRHPRQHWRVAYPLHERLFVAKSRRSRAEIARRAGQVDVLLQYLLHFAPTDVPPSPVPYCLYADWTTALTARHYPQWTIVAVGGGFERRQRPLLAGAACVFTFTDLVRASLVEDYGLPPERVVRVGAGINLDRLPDDAPSSAGRGSREAVLLTVANAFELKGIDVLLRALPLVRRRHPGCRVVLAGEAARSVRRPPPGVELRPQVGKAELERLYRAADLFVLPTRAEPFGIAFAEAMAFSLPCVGTSTGGVPEVIADGETGCLVPPGDHVALAEVVVDLLSDPARLSAMGRSARARAEREFTWDRVAERMLPHLQRAAEGGGRPARAPMD